MTRVCVVATTYFAKEGGKERAEAFIHAARSWADRLGCSYPVDLIVADDDSDPAVFQEAFETVVKIWAGYGRGQVGRTISDSPRGVGASLNRGFHAYANTELYLYAVDDWRLQQSLNLDPWIELLQKRDDVGVVRLGPPHPETVMRVRAWTENWQGWAGELLPEHGGVVISERPALWHRRMVDTYGPFKEDCSALECEADYDARYRVRGRDWPWLRVLYALPHPWMHLEASTLSGVDPRDR